MMMMMTNYEIFMGAR